MSKTLDSKTYLLTFTIIIEQGSYFKDFTLKNMSDYLYCFESNIKC